MKTDVFRRRVTEDPADPGFGAKVSAASGQRLLNRDGTFNARRRGVRSTQTWSPYHDLLNMSWSRFTLAVVGLFLGLNLVFALAFALCGPGAISGPNASTFGSRLLECFFLSAQTLSTVGYGHLAPASTAANIIAVVEMFFGFLMYAIAAGLAFARFSRPMAKIVFSDRAVVAPYGDATALMFRFANTRKNQLVEVQVKVLFSMLEVVGGEPARRYFQLDLERERVAFIPLHLTVVHPITAASPLHGLSREDMARGSAELLVLVTAMDETFSQTVHARTSYTHAEIEFGSRFATVLTLGDDGVVEVDLQRFHELERVQ
ncbi:MAG TPA: ion channel [Candidatus Krumholzibacteria bacterium]|nr:ion channel [Candidatus Krumholzibacteria bacterium]